MANDSTTAATEGSHLSEADAEHLKKLEDQLWFLCNRTGDPVALSTYQQLQEFRQRLIGEKE